MAVEHRLFCSLALVLLTAGVAQPTTWGGFASFKDQSKSYSCSKDDNQCKLTQVVLESDGDIERATFEGLLDEVVVASGRIPRFTAALANRLPNVSDLTLDRLSIVKLYVSASLTDLSAVGNEIDELLLDGSGDGPYHMISLYLSHNQLAALPSLARFGKLKNLELDHNLLAAVDVAAFAALTALRKLSLAHNRLHTVTGTMQLYRLKTLSFASNELVALNVTGWELDALEDLRLADNGLTRVEGNLTQFGALRKLTLAGNRLHCDWLMAEPLLVASSPPLQLDADGVDRCEADSMLPYGDHCCTHGGGSGGAGFGLLSVYQEKWDQLERLAQLIGTLNASIANGSVAVRTELARQHDALSVRLDELRGKGESHAEQLQTLGQRLGAHRDALDTLETDLAGRVGDLRAELEARWNETLATNGTNGGDGSSSSSPGWSRAAAQHEATLGRLRTELETVRGQFNVLNTKCYDPRPRLQEQARRIDQLDQELARSRELHRELREKYGERERKMNAMYELYSRYLISQSNCSDDRNIIPEVDESADQLDDQF